MASNRVFVSPGVYTSEKDLTFVTRSVGVTTLGLVGETTKGPAFQPIFISNYDEFKSFFGPLNATKFIDSGFPQYELPYIAKSYLSQTNQLYVTRVLGLSGYDAGRAWGITLNGAIDPATEGYSGTTTISIDYSGTGTSTVVTLTTTDPYISYLWANKATYTDIQVLANELMIMDSGATASNSDFIWYKPDETLSAFVGIQLSGMVKTAGSASTVTGTVTANTVVWSGTAYTEVQDRIVALLRSRGTYADQTIAFELSGGTYVPQIDPTFTNALLDPLGEFKISGLSSAQGAFTYTLSLDNTNQNYIINALGSGAFDKSAALFVEEIYDAMFDSFVGTGGANSKVRGINLSLVDYGQAFKYYKFPYVEGSATPYVVSQVVGNQIYKLFNFITISDGNHANQEIKISIVNIKPDDREFDIVIRSFYDTDAKPSILEKFSKCGMDPTLNNYVGKKIGTLDGEFPSKSNYVLIDIVADADSSKTLFPAGFLGFPQKDYQVGGNSGVTSPLPLYKKEYTVFENKRKFYLGLSDTVGIDQNLFNYLGAQDDNGTAWTDMTKGFHMDIEASGAGITVDGLSVYSFEVGVAPFKSEYGVTQNSNPYEKIYARKFTFAPYGGYDGWDIYRKSRTNTDAYQISGTKGIAGVTSSAFETRVAANGENGITSDYYAYLDGILTFSNPEDVNINVFATPGIDGRDNGNLIEATIDMIENDRADSLYIINIPDVDGGGSPMSAEEAVANLDDQGFDSNYSCTYWPWVQVNDTENNVYIWLPPTRDVVRNIALTDNIAFPWFSVAGIERGDVDCIKARKKLTLTERDTLYEGRINPIATFATEGVKIWGNKTLQVKDTALNRINVRRLLLQARKLISAVSLRLLFDQNDAVVRNKFLSLVNPILENIRSARGLVDFRVVVDSDPESIDRNELNGRIFIKPTRALEFINIEFVVTPTGASFDNL